MFVVKFGKKNSNPLTIYKSKDAKEREKQRKGVLYAVIIIIIRNGK